MSIRALGPLLALVALTVPVSLDAQDRFGTLLDWGTVQIVLSPTEHHGVRFELGTTAQVSIGAGGGMAAGFEPGAVQGWLAQARAVTRPLAPPTTPRSMLVTPPLVSLRGDSIRLARQARGRRWNGRIRVVLDGTGRSGRRFDVLARPHEVEALMAGLQREAGLSGWSTDSVRRAEAWERDPATVEMSDASQMQPPEVMRAGTAVHPDPEIRGRVLFEFVVDTTGRVDPYSIHPIQASDVRLIPWGREVLRDSRYHPARYRGQPVNVMVRQMVNFAP